MEPVLLILLFSVQQHLRDNNNGYVLKIAYALTIFLQ